MPSTQRPNTLASPARLEQVARVLAFVDGVVSPVAAGLYEFHPKWRARERVRVGRFHDSEGDECFLWFSSHGAVVSGYSKEHGRAEPDDVFAGLPRALAAARTEPAFGDEVSFALWRTTADDRWRAGNARRADGSSELLARFDDHPLAYLDVARVVYETAPEMRWVDAVWRGKTVTPAVVQGLGGPDADVAAAFALAKRLGIPHAKKLVFDLAPRDPKKKHPKAGDHDAFFVVSEDRGVVSLSFGGKPVASAKNPDLFGHLVEYARRAIDGAKKR